MKFVLKLTGNYSIIFLLLLVGITTVHAAGKIGFVDMETLINSSPQIANARDTIASEFQFQYDSIEQQEADLEILENRITKDGPIMSLAELSKLQERARILERQISRAKEDLKDAISIRNSVILAKVEEELNEVVKKYAIDNGYDAILINAILYVSDDIDITQEILQILKQKHSTDGN